MHHAITVGGLLSFICIVAGLLMGAIGLLTTFAAGMATAPDDDMAEKGCVLSIAGVALVVGWLVWLLFGGGS